MAKGSGKRTERDRYWLRQHAASAASGLSAKAYAARHGFSVHSLYQARRRLRRRGLLGAPAEDPSKAKRASRGRFARLAVAAGPQPRYRVRLRNGAWIEWEGAAGPELAQVLGVVSQLG